MIKKISFEIETTTPMFLAGADQSKAELRAASIKGLLRFWWRALQAESNLDSLREKESKIFGSSDEKTGGGSSFAIRIAHEGVLETTNADLPKHNITVTSKGKSFPVNVLEYLAYGPCSYDKVKKKNVIVRKYISSGFKFNLHLSIFKQEFLNEILEAMYVFDLFGGVGSKSRNGFGSFFITNKDECFNSIANDISVGGAYTKENLQKVVKGTELKAYTTFAEGTNIFRAKESYATWDKTLGEVGKIYRGIRSGDIRIRKEKGEGFNTFEQKHKCDKRQYIGSPIVADRRTKSLLDRHAKPYFIKIAKEGDIYRAYILYLPSRYCIELDNAVQHDRKFTEVCNEFNAFLSQHMEVII
ncbi:MAG: type III-B CRISPR module RAMP protein Cmr1 [Nitrospirae bacterium]|nr:type III-B CRISPR module RAMP protein Cmr1 [Nitrospirota bacterium]